MSSEGNRPSADTTLAVMLGVSKCPKSPHLSDLPGSTNAAEDFYSYLTGDFGLAEENIKDLFDSRKSPAQQLGEIGEWLFSKREALKDLIIFYTGHGGFTPGDRKFFLATRATTELMEGGTSIRIADLATVLKVKAPFARKYLIFDCCFAGSVVAEFMSSPGSVAVDKTKEVFPPRGTAVLCSSSSQEVSIAPTGGQYTRFGEALFGGLRDGNKQVPTDLSLHDVGAQIRERILDKYPEDRMRPEVHSPDQVEGDVASVHLFPNGALRSGRRQERHSPPLSPVAPAAAVTTNPPVVMTPTVEQKPRTPLERAAAVTTNPPIVITPTVEQKPLTALDRATKENPWVNSLGMKFVPVAGTGVLFSVWATRVQDFEAFVADSKYDPPGSMWPRDQDGRCRREVWSVKATWREPGFIQGPTHPVVGVSRNDAKKFCEWLTGREQGSGMLPPGRVYRLPTDVEWSAAVGLQGEDGNSPKEKSGKIQLYPWGKQWPPPKGAGNYAGEESNIKPDSLTGRVIIKGYNDGYSRTSPVGSFAANASGLYDMGGNVWQWCEDAYDNVSPKHRKFVARCVVAREQPELDACFPSRQSLLRFL